MAASSASLLSGAGGFHVGNRKSSMQTHITSATEGEMTSLSDGHQSSNFSDRSAASMSLLSSPYRRNSGQQYDGPAAPASVGHVLGGSGGGIGAALGAASASATATATSSSTTVASLSGDNKSTNDAAASATHSAVTANVRYRNDDGRAAVLRVAQTVNHDFGALTSIMNVTLGSIEALDVLSANPDIEWVDRNGAVFFVQPFGKS